MKNVTYVYTYLYIYVDPRMDVDICKREEAKVTKIWTLCFQVQDTQVRISPSACGSEHAPEGGASGEPRGVAPTHGDAHAGPGRPRPVLTSKPRPRVL